MSVQINEERLKELGEAERVLKWIRGAIQDYINGRPKDDVFEELLGLYLHEPDAVNDPAPLTTAEILAGSDGGWKS